MNRREFVSVAGGAGAATLARTVAAGAEAQPGAPRAGMVVGCQRAPTDRRRLEYFRRHGVERICGYPDDALSPASWTAAALRGLRELCEAHGVGLAMVELPAMSSASIEQSPRKGVMLGREPERQREIDAACSVIRACAEAGIPAVKYNLNLLGVLRTADTPGRGGARNSSWRLAEAPAEPSLTAAGRVSAELAWERIGYFLDRALPVAEESRVRLACHPHDPGVPATGFRGVVRVLGTVEGLKRFVETQASPYHGLNLCLGSVAEMLQDPAREIHDVVRYFGGRGKIFNVHFRNIRGRRDSFQEVFPDEGDMDMAAVMRTLQEVGYSGMVMPDHMPRHDDDPGQDQAFAFGYGYIKALIQAVGA